MCDIHVYGYREEKQHTGVMVTVGYDACTNRLKADSRVQGNLICSGYLACLTAKDG